MRSSLRFLTNALDTRRFSVAVVVAGALLRVALLAYLSRFPLKGDSAAYHEMALQLLRGEVFTPYRAPGIPYVLATFSRVAGTSELAARVTGLFWYFALMLVVYRVARLTAPRRAANLALLVVAVFPGFVWHSTEPLTQLPTAVFLLLVCYLSALLLRAFAWHTVVILGLTLGLAVVSRPSTLLLALVVPVVIAVVTRRAWTAAVALGICGVIVGAWMMQVKTMTGRVVFINDANVRNLFYGNNRYTPLYRTWWFGSHDAGDAGVPDEYTDMVAGIEQQPEAARAGAYRHAALTHILRRPDLFALRTINRMRVYLAFDTFTGSALRSLYGIPTSVALLVIAVDAAFYCFLCVAGILFVFLWTRTRRPRDVVWLIFLVVACYSLPYWFSFSHPTYHMPILPLVTVLAAAFLSSLSTGNAKSVLAMTVDSSRRRRALSVALLLFAFIQIEWIVFGLGRV